MKRANKTPLKIDFTRINNDVYGNPRYVCHYLDFKPLQNVNEPYKSFEYSEALRMAKSLGGRKYHNKQYGGGIVFQSYDIEILTAKILLMTTEAINYVREPYTYESKHGNTTKKIETFLLKDVQNRKGNLKKWFLVEEYNGDKTKYKLA